MMYPVAVGAVVAALGGPAILGVAPATLSELSEAVANGLPRAVVSHVAATAAPPVPALRQKVAALMVSPATLKRSPRLSAAASERAERLARVAALATQALGNADEARRWLTEPHPMMGTKSPIEVAATDLGARQVERVLQNIEYGLPA
jgi:putative toxin-antitoxin system antitoxin component (TIGR02293 family)